MTQDMAWSRVAHMARSRVAPVGSLRTRSNTHCPMARSRVAPVGSLRTRSSDTRRLTHIVLWPGLEWHQLVV